MAPISKTYGRGWFSFVTLFLAFLLTVPIKLYARPNTHPLTVQTEGLGTVARNPSFDAYPDGSTVTVTATPTAGWLFSHWSGDLTGSQNPANILMDDSKTITAHFNLIPTYNLTIAKTGEGNVLSDPAGGSYLSNSVVTLTAVPEEGWVFVQWSGDLEGSVNPQSITMDKNKNVSAEFAEKPAIVNAPENVLVGVGEKATFTVNARGSGQLTYEWRFGNTLLSNTTSTLIVNNVQFANEGTYTVTVRNAYGTATASANLQVINGCSGTNVVTELTEAALRAAVEMGGSVRLCFNGTITLTQPIVVTKNVSLDGRNRDVVISGNNATRLFQVSTNIDFAANHVTFANGKHAGTAGTEESLIGQGGAILNEGGTVSFEDCKFVNNSAIGAASNSGTIPRSGHGQGGAIHNHFGNLTLVSVTFSNNIAIGGAGSPSFIGNISSGDGRGGAISSLGGNVTVTNSLITSNATTVLRGANRTEPGSRGGGLYLHGTISVISGTSFLNNNALGQGDNFGESGFPMPAYGGALYINEGDLRLMNSTFATNIVMGGRGYRGSANAHSFGGAIFSEGPLWCSNIVFASNIAVTGLGTFSATPAQGGALYTRSNAVVISSVFHSNRAEGGSRISEGERNYSGSPGEGGAIYNLGSIYFTNSTFALNAALGGGSSEGGFGLSGPAMGGGIYNGTNAGVILMNVTIASNKTVAGRGTRPITSGANIYNASGGSVAIRNSIVAYPDGAPNVEGVITDGGHNISSDGSANFNSGTSFNFTNPRLLPLSDNGGPTMTMRLEPNSPAIDFASSFGAPSVDQRGFPRPAALGYDIGAFELQPSTFNLQLSITKISESTVLMQFQARAGYAYQFQSAGPDFQWITIEATPTASASGTVSREYSNDAPARFYRVIATQ